MTSAKARREQIVEATIRLGRGRTYERLGLREVASAAGVALGTLYKSFRNKEEIIGAAIGQETVELRQRFLMVAAGDTAVERVGNLFRELTESFCRRPAFARAVLAGLVSERPTVAPLVLAHQRLVMQIIVAAMRGVRPDEVEPMGEREEQIAFYLRQIWFAGVVGWSADLYTPAEVAEQVRSAAELMIGRSAQLTGRSAQGGDESEL